VVVLTVMTEVSVSHREPTMRPTRVATLGWNAAGRRRGQAAGKPQLSLGTPTDARERGGTENDVYESGDC